MAPVVKSHRPVFENRPRARAEAEGSQSTGPFEGALLRAFEDHDRCGGSPAIDTGLDGHFDQCEIGIERPDPHRHRRRWRHGQRRLRGRLDRHLGGQIGRDLNAMLERLRDHHLAPSLQAVSRLEHQTVRSVLRSRAVGAQTQRKRHAGPRQVAGADLQFQIAVAVAIEVDPG